MGELIRKYGTIEFDGKKYDVELNGPISDLGGIIHIQSESIRIEFSQKDFYSIVSQLRLAKKQLIILKEGEGI